MLMVKDKPRKSCSALVGDAKVPMPSVIAGSVELQ